MMKNKTININIFNFFTGKGRVSSPSLNVEKSNQSLLGASGSDGDNKLKPRSR